jgi:hypothetical protein
MQSSHDNCRLYMYSGKDKKMKRTNVLSVLFGLAFISQTFAATTVQLNPTNDAFTQNTLPTTNFGNNVNLSVINVSGIISQSYLQFDLSGYSNIESAYLCLYESYGPGSYLISVYSTTTNWTESTLTWNNQPALTGASVSLPSNTANPYSFDVTSFAQAAAGGSLSLGIKGATSSTTTFRSSENSLTTATPCLLVTCTPPPAIPAPGSLVLVALGLLGLAVVSRQERWLRRRRFA